MRGAFLELAEAEATVERFDAEALGLLAREIGCDAAFFAVKGSEARPAVLGMDAAVIAHAVRPGSEYEKELMPVKRAALSARGVAVDTAVLGEAEVRRAKYFRELAARVHGRHSLMAYLRWRGEPRAAILLGRSGSSFSQREVERVEAVLPELAAARAVHGWPYRESLLPALPRSGWLSRARLRGPGSAPVVTRGGTVYVRDRAGFREMVSQGHSGDELIWTRARVARPSESGWPYVELFHVAAGLARQRRRALFIGLGGGVAVRQFGRAYPGIALDVVESEPQVIALAREWYDIASIPGLTLHVGDGAEHVAHATPASIDIIVVDAYTDAFVAEFANSGFYANVRRALAPGGAVALNVISRLDGTGELPAIVAGLQAELRNVRVVPVLGTASLHATDWRNVVVIAHHAS